MEKITIRIRDKPQIRVKLAERKPIKINIHRLNKLEINWIV